MHFIQAKSLLSPKNGMNVYRGCTHGCIYCDSRSSVYQMNHAFEDVAVKENAPELLEAALSRKRKRCMIGFGSMSDPYIPLERELKMTRKCLGIISQYRFGVSLITKSDLILRDIDLITEINEKAKAVVSITLTTADDVLCKKIEPHVCTASRRAEVLCALHDAGIATVVWLCPFLPFINDTEENMMSLLKICRDTHVHGVLCFGTGLTLREGNREYLYEQFEKDFPGMKERYQETFGDSYECASAGSARLMNLVQTFCRENGILSDTNEVFTYMNSLDGDKKDTQMKLCGY
ncbi:MAG TPA: radical SAM protein [Methanocorpusculum sp.]|nr:radical SAM protein [Methanocorpusculum sp.]